MLTPLPADRRRSVTLLSALCAAFTCACTAALPAQEDFLTGGADFKGDSAQNAPAVILVVAKPLSALEVPAPSLLASLGLTAPSSTPEGGTRLGLVDEKLLRTLEVQATAATETGATVTAGSTLAGFAVGVVLGVGIGAFMLDQLDELRRNCTYYPQALRIGGAYLCDFPGLIPSSVVGEMPLASARLVATSPRTSGFDLGTPQDMDALVATMLRVLAQPKGLIAIGDAAVLAHFPMEVAMAAGSSTHRERDLSVHVLSTAVTDLPPETVLGLVILGNNETYVVVAEPENAFRTLVLESPESLNTLAQNALSKHGVAGTNSATFVPLAAGARAYDTRVLEVGDSRLSNPGDPDYDALLATLHGATLPIEGYELLPFPLLEEAYAPSIATQRGMRDYHLVRSAGKLRLIGNGDTFLPGSSRREIGREEAALLGLHATLNERSRLERFDFSKSGVVRQAGWLGNKKPHQDIGFLNVVASWGRRKTVVRVGVDSERRDRFISVPQGYAIAMTGLGYTPGQGPATVHATDPAQPDPTLDEAGGGILYGLVYVP